jgi:hypothetical protein
MNLPVIDYISERRTMRQKREGKRSNRLRRNVQPEGNQPEEGVQPGEDWVHLEVPENMEEMLLKWTNFDRPTVGWCLLCDGPILSEENLIPGTNTHRCAAGWRFEREHSES